MPEKGNLKEKLAGHLRRCGVIYVAGIVALVLLNNLIFTMTRPRVPENETVRVMAINQYADFSQQEKEWLKKVHAADETVRALEFETIWYDSEQYEMSMAMPIKLMAGGYDLLIADEIGFEALLTFGAFRPLDEYLGDAADVERIAVTDSETGAEFVGAMRMDFLGLKDVYVGVSANSENPDSTWTAFKVLREVEGAEK